MSKKRSFLFSFYCCFYNWQSSCSSI